MKKMKSEKPQKFVKKQNNVILRQITLINVRLPNR